MSKIINVLITISTVITLCGISIVMWRSIGLIASHIEASSLEKRDVEFEEYNREVFRDVIVGERQE